MPDNHSFHLPSKNYNNRSQGTDIKTHLVNQYSGTEDPYVSSISLKNPDYYQRYQKYIVEK